MSSMWLLTTLGEGRGDGGADSDEDEVSEYVLVLGRRALSGDGLAERLRDGLGEGMKGGKDWYGIVEAECCCGVRGDGLGGVGLWTPLWLKTSGMKRRRSLRTGCEWVTVSAGRICR